MKTITFIGKGIINTAPFVVEKDETSFELSYKAGWDGHFAVQLIKEGKNRQTTLPINQPVVVGQTYKTFIYGFAGELHFAVVVAPPDENWELTCR